MVFAHTDVNAVIGITAEGLKIVSTVVTVTDTNTAATQITMTPLKRIIAWNFFPRNPGTTPTTFVAAAGTASNQIGVTPTADAIGAVLQILAVGE